MRRAIIFLLTGLFISGCIVPPGQVKKQSAPGQIKKKTGYNPASGKQHLHNKWK